MAQEPLITVDLRGKNLEEVVKLLGDTGFSVHTTETQMWDSRWKPSHPDDMNIAPPPVHVVWVQDSEAEMLGVTFVQGEKVITTTLEPGMDLHMFENPPSQGPGQEWFPIKTLNIMR